MYLGFETIHLRSINAEMNSYNVSEYGEQKMLGLKTKIFKSRFFSPYISVLYDLKKYNSSHFTAQKLG